MTLRTALVIDGDASGAKAAAAETDAGLKKVNAAAVAAARAEQVRAQAALSSLKANQAATKEEIAAASAALRKARAALDAARSVEAEAAATAAATGAIKTNTAAQAANNAVMRQATAQRANLVFQLNDIFVSLASGMNPAMVAIQQGSQISTIYGPGGLGKALSETGKIAVGLVTKFWPVALAVGAVTAAVAGLTHEINRTGDGIEVTMGDTALAVLQTFGDYIYDFIKPAIDGIAKWFNENWDTVTKVTADVVNWYARTWLGVVDRVVTAIGTIPDSITVAFQTGMQAASDAVTWTIREIIASVNGMIASINGMAEKAGLGRPLASLGSPSRIEYSKVDFGGAAAAARLGQAWSGFDKRDAERGKTDYAGQFFSDVAEHARLNALRRQEEDKAKVVKKTTDAVREQRTAWDELANVGRDAFDRLTDTILAGGKDILGTLQSIAGDFAKLAFQMAITNPLKNFAFGGSATTFGGNNAIGAAGGIFGSLFGVGGMGGFKSLPGLGGLSGSVKSFDGGGSTGRGPRAGGLDGKGGFLGLLHPDETVVDHTRGNAPAMQPINNFYGVPSKPEVRPNGTGGFDYIFGEIDRRLSDGRLGRGFASRHGISPTTRRT